MSAGSSPRGLVTVNEEIDDEGSFKFKRKSRLGRISQGFARFSIGSARLSINSRSRKSLSGSEQMHMSELEQGRPQEAPVLPFSSNVTAPSDSKLRLDARPHPLSGHHPMHPYEALVFKGGGAKGAIYPGAIKALEDAGIMP